MGSSMLSRRESNVGRLVENSAIAEERSPHSVCLLTLGIVERSLAPWIPGKQLSRTTL